MKKMMMAVLCLGMLVGCSSKTAASGSEVTITNPVELNTVTLDMSGYEWLNDSEPAFTEITLHESIRMFSEKGTGIVFYGFPGCSFCQRAVPEMNAVAKELGISIYYIDVTNNTLDADHKEDDFDVLSGYISSVFVNDNFQVPEVIAVKDGEIVGNHLSLVDDFKITSDDSQMNDEQKKELQDIYKGLIDLVKD